MSPRHALSLKGMDVTGRRRTRVRGSIDVSTGVFTAGRPNMRLAMAVAGIALLVVASVVVPCLLQAGEVTPASGYSLLSPIRSGNLTVFPVVASKSYDTVEFLTLDEGLRSGDVVVTEAGQARGLIRHRPRDPAIMHPVRDADVNRLVLVNNSKRPLVLLAGEIVTGGKQDRVIGKDRIVPADSDPIDLDVFCVEPGRWVGHSEKFVYGSINGAMAAPSVRGKAMSEKDQQQVWAEVGKAKQGMARELRAGGLAAPPAPVAAQQVESTTSYARVMQNDEVKTRVDSMARPIELEYQSTIQQLRDRDAVGVVVAVNGEIVWADIFASTSLLEKYWPKLVRSYASEAVVTRAKGAQVSAKTAQAFVENLHR